MSQHDQTPDVRQRTAAPLPMKTPRQVVTEWAAAFNRHDATAAAALYHDDATNIQVALGEPVRGRQAIHDNFAAFFRAFPDSDTQVEHVFEDGEWAIIEWSGGGTMRGEFARHAPTGRSFTLRGCGFFHVVDGRIHFQRGYWDKATWFHQLGIPLEPGLSPLSRLQADFSNKGSIKKDIP